MRWEQPTWPWEGAKSESMGNNKQQMGVEKRARMDVEEGFADDLAERATSERETRPSAPLHTAPVQRSPSASFPRHHPLAAGSAGRPALSAPSLTTIISTIFRPKFHCQSREKNFHIIQTQARLSTRV